MKSVGAFHNSNGVSSAGAIARGASWRQPRAATIDKIGLAAVKNGVQPGDRFGERILAVKHADMFGAARQRQPAPVAGRNIPVGDARTRIHVGANPVEDTDVFS